MKNIELAIAEIVAKFDDLAKDRVNLSDNLRGIIMRDEPAVECLEIPPPSHEYQRFQKWVEAGCPMPPLTPTGIHETN